jgi:predicted DNA-binding ribbon-helix-helix protein
MGRGVLIQMQTTISIRVPCREAALVTEAKQATARPVKRSFSLQGHRTSISLEQPFWEALKEAAQREGISLAALVARIDEKRNGCGLSGAVRIWVLDYVSKRTAAVHYDGGNRD